MSAVLLDTHVWAWSLTGDARLTRRALLAISATDSVLVSPISFFEIGKKVRLGKWPQMAPFVEEQGGAIATLSPAVCLRASMMAWEHRDPFDRLLAATAQHQTIPLITADEAFDTVPDLTRIW